MIFVLVLLIGLSSSNSIGEYSFKFETDIQNITKFLLDAADPTDDPAWIEEIKEKVEEYRQQENLNIIFCRRWLGNIVRELRWSDPFENLQICFNQDCDNQADCPFSKQCILTPNCEVIIDNETSDFTNFTIQATFLHAEVIEETLTQFGEYGHQLQFEIEDRLSRQINTSGRSLGDIIPHVVDRAEIMNVDSMCRGCVLSDDDGEDGNGGDNGGDGTPDGDLITGPFLAKYSLSSLIIVTQELTVEQITEMQDHLMHIDHLAGVTTWEMEPKRGSSSVLFKFQPDTLSPSYKIEWNFSEEHSEDKYVAELEATANIVKASADKELNEYVESMDEITSAEATGFEIDIDDFDDSSCDGSKIEYYINVDAYFNNPSDANGMIDRICKECLQTAPHVSIHDLIDIGCSSDEQAADNHLIRYGFTKKSSDEIIFDKDIIYYTDTLQTQASNCINEMISKNQLKSETTVETVHTILCGFIENYSFPPEAMAGAIIGSLIGFGFLIATIICIRNEHNYAMGVRNEANESLQKHLPKKSTSAIETSESEEKTNNPFAITDNV